MNAAGPLVSVIVPVRGDVSGVRSLVRRLALQTLARDRFEVVVGVDGPRTQEAVARLATDDGWLRVVAGPERNSYAARNRAAGAARSAVLAFCDSDCLPEPDWLARGLAALQEAQIVAGEVRFVASSRPSTWSLLTIDTFLDQQRDVRASVGVTANLFVARELFERGGGFDESFPSGGDYDFVRRSVADGARLVYEPRAVVMHPTIDERRLFLRKVWTTSRWAAVRRAQARAPFSLLESVELLLPLVGPAIVRHRARRPLLHLDRRRLEAAGVSVSLRQEAQAMALVYLLVPYIAGLGRVSGWLAGRAR